MVQQALSLKNMSKNQRYGQIMRRRFVCSRLRQPTRGDHGHYARTRKQTRLTTHCELRLPQPNR
jgi:hypothetical protein